MSLSVKYGINSNDKKRHVIVNHCDVTGTHLTKENPVHSFGK